MRFTAPLRGPNRAATVVRRSRIPSPILTAILALAMIPAAAAPLPDGFIYLRETAPEIAQDMRYYGSHNFIGRPIPGYEAPECILTREAAVALKAVQAEVAAEGLRVKVLDCYRPKRAVAEFVRWGRDTADQRMKNEFYPRVDKAAVFQLGYIAERSGHSRGSTVDLVLVPADAPPGPAAPAGPAATCTAPFAERFPDSPLDFGTAFDCLDPLSHPDNTQVPAAAQANRARLARAMEHHGFRPLTTEWWHFTLKAEPFPDTYFDFPVTAPEPAGGTGN